MNLFKLGEFKSHSDNTLQWKIDCDALTSDDWDCLAVILLDMIEPFGSVEGVPQGGLLFASALQKYVTQGPILIVDDVLTTGNSMEEIRNGRNAIGAVVFARGVCPSWITPIFRLENKIS